MLMQAVAEGTYLGFRRLLDERFKAEVLGGAAGGSSGGGGIVNASYEGPGIGAGSRGTERSPNLRYDRQRASLGPDGGSTIHHPPNLRFNRQHKAIAEHRDPPSLVPGPRGAHAGRSGVPYEARSATEAMAISQAEWDAFREGVTDIEGKRYDRMGGAGHRFAGRYQMGPNEITDTARRLDVPRQAMPNFWPTRLCRSGSSKTTRWTITAR